jgi:hypothetical protein
VTKGAFFCIYSPLIAQVRSLILGLESFSLSTLSSLSQMLSWEHGNGNGVVRPTDGESCHQKRK